MFKKRIIPCLLLKDNRLVKTIKFKGDRYIGDPINAVRIFSEKEADEIIILDIDASIKQQEPNYELISELAGECFMPVTYGGGIKNINQVKKLIRSGIEKVVINTEAYTNIDLISDIANIYGSQAIVGAIDVKKNLLGIYSLKTRSSSIKIRVSLIEHIANLIKAGIGELLINNIDKDGTMNGYDLELIKKVYDQVNIPVIVCGGAGNFTHLKEALNIGISGVVAGSMFIYHGKHKAVLINYPKERIFWLNGVQP